MLCPIPHLMSLNTFKGQVSHNPTHKLEKFGVHLICCLYRSISGRWTLWCKLHASRWETCTVCKRLLLFPHRGHVHMPSAKFAAFLTPPPCLHFGPILNIKFTQPTSAFGVLPSTRPTADIICTCPHRMVR